MNFAHALQKEGFFVPAIRYASVARGTLVSESPAHGRARRLANPRAGASIRKIAALIRRH